MYHPFLWMRTSVPLKRSRAGYHLIVRYHVSLPNFDIAAVLEDRLRYSQLLCSSFVFLYGRFACSQLLLRSSKLTAGRSRPLPNQPLPPESSHLSRFLHQLPLERMSQEVDLPFCRPPMGDPKVCFNDQYRYEPLLRKSHIRLLILNPGMGEDILVGSIKTVDLNASDLDSFEAISYVWGSHEKDKSILIDGRRLPITTSLREALLQTRLSVRPRILWADSVCINQSDIIEKGHQVFAMGRIYKMSCRTIICLGRQQDDEHKAHDAAALINDVEAMIKTVMRDPAFRGGFDSFPWPSKDDPLLVDTRWLSAWNTLVRHAWFKRGWVVQEAALGDDALIHWAGAQIEWMSLLKVEYWLYYRALPMWRPGREQPKTINTLHSDSFHLRRGKEAGAFVPRYLDSNIRAMTTLSVLQSARFLNLTDPRDRIYAFMALETKDGVMAKLELQPDYGRPHREVFYEFARRYLQETSDLEILTHVDHDEEGLIGHHNMPSWVPQWDAKTICHPIHDHHPACEPFSLSDQQLRSTDIIHESELRLRGVFVGRIHYASRKIVNNPKDPIEEVLKLWWEVAPEIKKLPGPFRGRMGFALLDAMSLGQSTGEDAPWVEAKSEFARRLDLNNDKYHSRQITQDPAIYGNAYRVSLSAIESSRNRRIFVLEQGFIGVTSAGARQGDLCALISGLCSPLILRPVSGKPDHYILVGNAFLVLRTDVIGGRFYPLRSDSSNRAWIHEYLPVHDIILE